jgi:predicted peptidase
MTQTGFLDRAIVVEGVRYPYQVYVPSSYDDARAWPVVLFLHGAGERGADGLLQTSVGIAPAIRRNPERFPGIVVMPQAPLESFWAGPPGDAALAALERTQREFDVDEDRTYLTGLSMGGHGSWILGYHHRDRFAAMLVICGFVGDRPNRPSIVPSGDGTPYERVASRLRDMPIWIVHGEADPAVPVDESRRMAAALRAVGAPVAYTELPGTYHDSWTATYGSEAIIRWLFEQRRQQSSRSAT